MYIVFYFDLCLYKEIRNLVSLRFLFDLVEWFKAQDISTSWYLFKMQPQQADTGKELFVLQDEKLLKFKLPLQKVLGFCPMFNNTFVVMGIKTLRYECIAHYDAEGNVIKEKVFHDSNLYPYIIPTDREIYWVDNDRDVVCCWDLKEDKYL